MTPRLFIPRGVDKPGEECGIFGVSGSPDAAGLTVLGLHALQHRGQEATGVVSIEHSAGRDRFHSMRCPGLVSELVPGINGRDALPGHTAIGHVRYATCGLNRHENIQPLIMELACGQVALAHNGHLFNAGRLRDDLMQSGATFSTDLDSEVILHLMTRMEGSFEARLYHALGDIKGGFALLLLCGDRMVAVRDPHGIRPLVTGKLASGARVVASETCALDIIDARFERELEPGEVMIVHRNGDIRCQQPMPRREPRPCIFEYVYFSRPDSLLGGRSLYGIREACGRELARECPVEADVVVPVPDSGVPAAMGFAAGSGLPFGFGIIRNHFIGRSFIQPEPSIRDLFVRLKHNVNRELVQGQRVVLVDDSLVRGTTARKIVALLRQCGARSVHMRIASPPVCFPCLFGIDLPNSDELVARNTPHATLTAADGPPGREQTRAISRAIARGLHDDGLESLGSLEFLSIDALYRALGHRDRASSPLRYADHVFTGDYPYHPDVDLGPGNQPSLQLTA